MTPTPIDADVLHEALRQAPSIIIITDADLRIIYCNRVENGFRLEDILGRRHGHTLPVEHQERAAATMEHARRTGEPQAFEAFIDPPNGTRHWYTDQISVYTTSDGAASGMISIITDITRQRVAEMRLEALRRELVEASHRAGMAEIASGVLHDVGTVLNHITVSTDGLASELEHSRLYLFGRALAMLPDDGRRAAEFLASDPKGRKLPALLGRLGHELGAERERLRAQLLRLHELISRTRTIVEAQQSLAKLGTSAEPTRPDELVHRTLSMFHVDLDHHGIERRLELADVGSVMLDRQAALQVLACLVRNAIEALAVVERSRVLSIRLHVEDHKLCFDVEDNGCGIAPEHHARLFQHGFSTKPSGHGFGLRASAIAAGTMNGVIEAHSEGPDRGARFRLTVPRIIP